MRKKRIVALVCALTLAAGQTAYAQSVTVSVNGTALEQESFLRSGITYSPLTALLDALGGWKTGWNASERRARMNEEKQK